MNIKQFIIPLLMILPLWGSSQSLDWLASSSETVNDRAMCVAADQTSGYVYVGGSYETFFGNTVTLFDATLTADISVASGDLIALGGQDAYLACFNDEGTLLWIQNFGSSKDEEIIDLAVSPDGRVFVTGQFEMTFSFINTTDGLPVTLESEDGNGVTDSFIACFQPTGELLWAKCDGGDQDDMGLSIVANENQVVVLGMYQNQDALIAGTAPAQITNKNDMFMAAYDLEGNGLWAVTGGSEEDDLEGGVNLSELRWQIQEYNNDFYVLGTFYGTNMEFFDSSNSSDPINNLSSVDADADLFLARINADGVIEWTQKILVSGSTVKGLGLAVDCHGLFMSATAPVTAFEPIIFPSGWLLQNGDDQDIFIGKFDPDNGIDYWDNTITDPGVNELNSASLVTDGHGFLYLSGYFEQPLLFDGWFDLSPSAGVDGFVAQFNTNLTFLSALPVGGDGSDGVFDLGVLNQQVLISGVGSIGLSVIDVLLGNQNSFAGGISFSNDFDWECCTLPDPGTVSTSTPTICIGETATVTITGYTADDIQWWGSSDGDNWTELLGATSDIINFEPTADTYLKAQLTNACGETYSNKVFIDVFEFVCPDDTSVSVDDACEFLLPDYTASLATDGCSTADIVQSPAPGSILAVGMHTVEFFSGDLSVKFCEFDLSVEDTTFPVINCPGNTTIGANADCEFVIPDITAFASVTDNCEYLVSQIPAAGTALGLGTHTIMLKATDNAGNQSNCTFELEIIDDTPPAFSCPADQSANADDDCEYVIPSYVGFILATLDNCGATSWTQVPAVGTIVNSGDHTITITATDDAGNETTCDFNLEVVDVTDPDITCPGDQVLESTGGCSAILPDYTLLAVATDACNVPNIVQTPAPGTIVTGDLTITLAARDGALNNRNCQFDVDFQVPGPPTVTCPGNQFVTPNGDCDHILGDYTALASAFDECGTYTVTQSPLPGTVMNSNVTVTMTATDDEGETANCTFQANRVMTIGIAVIDCPDDQEISFDASCDATLPDYTSAVTTTNFCTGFSVNQSPPAGTSISVPTTVTLTATGVLNTEACTFVVTPVDDTDPVISCPGFTALTPNAACNFVIGDLTGLATTSDNCDADLTIVQTPPAGTDLGGFSHVTITATDDFGNSASCNINLLQVMPIFNPSVTCPGDMPASFTDDCEFTLLDYTGLASASDFCMPSLALTQSPVAGTVITGQATITITGTDAFGNTDSCTFDIIPEDTTDPVLTCIADQSATLSLDCDVILADYTALIGATDNCDSDLSFVQNPAPGTIITSTTSVTITVEDDAGNTSFCNFDVTLADTSNPVVICPSDLTKPLNADCEYIIEDYTGLVIASDCGSIASITQNPLPGVVVTSNTTIDIDVEDNEGNVSSCSFDVLLEDVSDPIITCPADQNEAPDCAFTLPDYPALMTADDCSAVTWTQDPVAGTDILVDTEITITAEDAAGNSTACSFWVFVLDTNAPVVNCPVDYSVSAGNACTYALDDLTDDVVVIHDCNPTSITQDPIAGTILGLGTHTVEITISDDQGNSTACFVDVTVEDNTDPVAVCVSSINKSVDTDCEYILEDLTGLVGVTENCSYTITQSPLAGSVLTLGVTNVTFTVEDPSGNTGNCSVNVLVVDTTSPTVICPGDVTKPANIDCKYSLEDLTGLLTVSDNCGFTTVTQAPLVGTIITGTQTITMTVEDISGNTTVCEFDVMLEDIEFPTIDCPLVPEVLTVGAGCDVALPDYSIGLSHDDNCGVASFTQVPAAGTLLAPGNYEVNIEVKDLSGNTTICTFDVEVVDDQWPLLDCPGDMTEDTDASCTYTMPDFEATQNPNDNCGIASFVQTPAPGTALTPGDYLTTITLTDNNGNESVCQFNIEVQQATSSQLICPPTQYEPAGLLCMAQLGDYTDLASAINCSGTVVDVPIAQSPAVGTLFLGSQTVTLSFQDELGATIECDFNVLATDDTPPVIVCVDAVVEIPVDDACAAQVGDYSSMINATDECSPDITYWQDPVAGTALGLGSSSVWLYAADITGNTDSCEVSIEVVDNTAPVVDCSATYNTTASDDCDYLLEDLTALVVATDNCSDVTITQGWIPGTALGLGTHDLPMTISDDAGNITNCTVTVIVTDITDPVILVCVDDAIVAADADCGFVLPDYTLDIVATDNCDTDLSLMQDPEPGTTQYGTTEIIITVVDDSNNSTTCEFEITVEDSTAPTVNCPAVIADIDADADCMAIIPDYTLGLVTSDNCAGALTISQIPAAGTQVGLGVTSIIITVEDAAGNTTQCDFDVEVVDATMPTIVTCAQVYEVAMDNSCTYLLEDLTGLLDVTDNCSAVNITQMIPPGTSLGVGTHEILFSISDDAGNATNCSVTLDVQDQTDPVIDTCLDDQIVSANDDCGFLLADYSLSILATDNCDADLDIVQIPAPGTEQFGVTNVTITITDDSGNSANCEFTVGVEDNTAPSINCPAIIADIDADADCMAIIPDYTLAVISTDNCAGDITLTQIPAPGTQVGLGVTGITITAEDASGNTTQCDFDVEVVDNTIPTIITCAQVYEVAVDDNCVYLLEDLTGLLDVTDNCSAVSITQMIPAGVNLGLGTHEILFSISDDAGNSTDCSVTVDVQDQTDPVIDTCIDDQMVSANGDCAYFMADYTAGIVATDNCDADLDITQDPVPGAEQYGATFVTIMVTDDSGNSTTCEFLVGIEDNTAPEIVCPIAVSNLEVGADCMALIPDYTTDVAVSDNCGGDIILTQFPPAGTATTVGVVEVTVVAEDLMGNSAQCVFDVLIEDVAAPVIETCSQTVEVSVDDNCIYTLEDLTGLVVATDNCTDVTVTQLTAIGTEYTIGDFEIFFDVSDANGNSVGCSLNLEVSDTTAPIIIECAGDHVVDADTDCGFTLADYTADIVATDNCDGALSITQIPLAGTIMDGPVEVVIQVLDANGNQTDCSFVVGVIDMDPPVIDCPDFVAPLAVDENCELQIPDFTDLAVVSDNCGGELILSQNPAAGTIITLGNTEVWLIAEDLMGNADSCSFNVEIIDDATPYAMAMDTDIQLTINADCEAEMPNLLTLWGVEDNCDADLDITQSPESGLMLVTGEYPGFFSVTDDYDNQFIQAFTVTVSDEMAPELECPGTQLLLVDDNCAATVPDYAVLAVASDCNDFEITQTPEAGESATEDFIVELTATDEAGNSVSCEFEVIMGDDQFPTIDCIEDHTIFVDDACDLTMDDFTTELTYNDNCDIQSVQQLPMPGSLVDLDTDIDVQVVVMDVYGNMSTCEFTVLYSDTVAPIIECPEDMVISVDTGCGIEVNFATPTSFDNCVTNTLIQLQGLSSGEEFPIGVTTQEFMAVDGSGNESICSFTVTVLDEISPVIDCPEQIESCDPVVVFDMPIATDNCPDVSIEQTDETGFESGSEFPLGTTTLQFTATDASGNETICMLQIIILDETEAAWGPLPEFLCENAEVIDLNDLAGSFDNMSWSAPFQDGLIEPGAIGPGDFDITLSVSVNGCEADSTLSLTIAAMPIVEAGDNQEVCGLEAELTGSGNTDDIEWQGEAVFEPSVFAAEVTIQAASYGTHTYTLDATSDEGCVSNDMVSVTFFEPPTMPDAGHDQELDFVYETFLNGTYNGPGEVNWFQFTETATIVNPMDLGTQVINLQEGENEFILIASNGVCPSLTDTMTVTVSGLLIPTGFSPNGDLVNDLFVIKGLENWENGGLTVFNRWGNKVYENTPYDNSWDGRGINDRDLPNDTYYFTLRIDETDHKGYVIIKR